MNRRPRIPIRAACLAAALALAATGCGGDNETPASGSTQAGAGGADSETFIEAVTSICVQTRADIDAISAEFEATPTEEQFTAGLKAGSARYLAGIESVRAVTPPPELAEKVASWLDAFTKDVKKLPTYTVEDAQKGLDAFAASDPLALDLGLKVCTSGG